MDIGSEPDVHDRGRKDLTYKFIEYQNSGDSKLYGDSTRVVGYNSIIVEKNKTPRDTKISAWKRRIGKLLDIARHSMEEYVSNGKIPVIDEKTLSPILIQPFGAFVTLRKTATCVGASAGLKLQSLCIK